jgi:hypothetical protein
MHPLYDPSELTDDEIITKLQKCYVHLADQQRQGHNATVSSIEQTILALETERQARMQRSMQAEADSKNAKEKKTGLEPIELGTIEQADNNEE